MNRCKNNHILIEKLVAKTINADEHAILFRHIRECKECSDMVSANNVLLKSESPLEKPDELDFKMMRSNVINSIRNEKEKSISEKFQKLFELIAEFLKKPEYAVAAITLIVGFFLGQALPPDKNGIGGGILKQISDIAEKNIYFSDSQKSSYRFSNVSLKELDNNKIEMSFDVSTNLDVVRDKNDPLVKEVLTQTMLSAENVGSNLRAISYTESITDNKIKQALIYVMHNAPITAVRLKSMESLMKYNFDPELQEAFIKVLLEEKTIKMNLMAIDYLTMNNYNPDSLKSIIEEASPQKSTAIFVRAKNFFKTNP